MVWLVPTRLVVQLFVTVIHVFELPGQVAVAEFVTLVPQIVAPIAVTVFTSGAQPTT
jgi:hypothetical protein